MTYRKVYTDRQPWQFNLLLTLVTFVTFGVLLNIRTMRLVLDSFVMNTPNSRMDFLFPWARRTRALSVTQTQIHLLG